MTTPHRVVFDCVVFAQALISNTGPAAECLKRAREKRIEFFVNSQILQEIRELPLKISAKHKITFEKAEQLADEMKLSPEWLMMRRSYIRTPSILTIRSISTWRWRRTQSS